MTGKQKKFLILFIFLLVIAGVGICINYMLENMLFVLNKSSTHYNINYPDNSYENGYSSKNNSESTVPEFSFENRQPDHRSPTAFEGQDKASSDHTPPVGQIKKDNVTKEDIAEGVEQKIGRPVDKKDLIAGGLIILRKLSWEEIRFLYEVGRKDIYTREELIKVNHILTTKLNQEERAKLKALGIKYGRNLRVLDEDFQLE